MHRSLALLVLLAACAKTPADQGGDDPADTDDTDVEDTGGEDTGEAAGVTIGVDGGQVDLGGGATLDIPAGALAEDVEITATIITDLAGWADAPTFTDGVRFAVALEPHGLVFAEPATLRLPHGGWDDRLAVMRTDDPSDTTWEVVSGAEDDGADAAVLVSGFSGYALVVVKDGSCPCFDAADVVQFNSHGRSVAWRSQLSTTATSTNHFFQIPIMAVYVERSEDSCEAAAYHFGGVTTTSGGSWSSNATEGPVQFEAFFPDLTPDVAIAGQSWTSYAFLRRFGISTDEQAACDTLILAGARGELAVPLEMEVTGLDTGTVTLSEAGALIATLTDGAQWVGEFLPDATPALSLSAPPSGKACTFDATGTTDATVELSAGPVGVTCTAAAPTPTTTTYVGSPASGVDTPTSTAVELEIPDAGTITDIDLQVELTGGRGFAREIEISLSHDGVTVAAHERVDNPAAPPYVGGVVNATFDDEAADPVPAPPADRGTGVTVDVIGTFRPDESLAAFDSFDLAGTWTLSLVDTGAFPNDGENVVSWSVVATVESTAVACPCWEASAFASAGFTSCTAGDYVPAGVPDGVDDMFTVGSSSVGFVAGTNTDPRDSFLFCTSWNPVVSATHISAEEHEACVADIQDAVANAGLTCP